MRCFPARLQSQNVSGQTKIRLYRSYGMFSCKIAEPECFRADHDKALQIICDVLLQDCYVFAVFLLMCLPWGITPFCEFIEWINICQIQSIFTRPFSQEGHCVAPSMFALHPSELDIACTARIAFWLRTFWHIFNTLYLTLKFSRNIAQVALQDKFMILAIK